MLSLWLAFVLLAAASRVSSTTASNCAPFPASVIEYSSSFKQPDPPSVNAEFTTSFLQHKWDKTLSHITAGFITNSPSQGFVRVDEAFQGTLASSYFNYANISKDGLVDNTMTSYVNGSTTPTVSRGYVNPDFPLFPRNLLQQGGAVFAGLVKRPLLPNQTVTDTRACSGISYTRE
ncbi:hypothetical protein ANO11243_028710 [Dothideomycetidae sp. 11243]|nr:hypothetical protein ANO11243_028710 [fungal sp. No.11243]